MTPVRPYQIELEKDVVVFVNGFKTRNILGFLWLWSNLPGVIRSAKRAEGCFESIPALVGPFQVVMVSYWQSKKYLNEYMRSKLHQGYISFVYKQPKALSLFNETYIPHQSGLYHNDAIGMAKLQSIKKEKQHA